MATPLKRLPDASRAVNARLECLRALERKLLWLSSWTIHQANHLRPSRDGLKVGGHQASSASLVSILTALYFDVLRPEDRISVKPHAAPVFHAIQYLLGHLDRQYLVDYRRLGGVQSYPSRTKDPDDVDFSSGSMGLGVAHTVFSSIVQDYVRLKGLVPDDIPEGRLVALVGDAELDEGNIFEALLEGWKKDLRNIWWVVDYNRQSLDSVVSDRLVGRIDTLFETLGWRVVTLKYGKLLERAFADTGGEALRDWIDNCPNTLYSALSFKGGAAWREHIKRDLGDTAGIKALLDSHDDAALGALMTNLAGNDLEAVLDAFHAVTDDVPTCFIAYTVKGFGLPLAGHKDNHAGLMNVAQMDALRDSMAIPEGEEWEKFVGLDVPAGELQKFLDEVPFAGRYPRRHATPMIQVPERFEITARGPMSTQEGFGRILSDIARRDDDFSRRVVTTSPDVTVSTNLGAWVNRRGVFHRIASSDTFAEEDVVSAQKWVMSPEGQHLELGIAEHNLFLALSALGLAGSMFGARLLPVGTLYDPFIRRGLDAMHYGCYQDSRYMLVATPSGITLAPEGGAHQAHETPLITLAQPGMVAFEPAFIDELALMMRWGFEYMQEDDGGSVCLRLSTRPLDQPERALDGISGDVLAGAYWLAPPAPGAELVIVYTGAVAPDAIDAHGQILEDIPGAGLLAVTSADRLHTDWMNARRARISGEGSAEAHVERLLGGIASDAALVTVIDGHPAALSWLGSVAGHRIYPLGVDRFGRSGDIPDLYREYGIDAGAILDAAARACIRGRLTG